jgi:formate/nitrite transporter
MHAVANVGLARLVAGCVFPVGLMMIVFVGGELFTGDCLMIVGCMHKEFSVWKMIKVLIVVWTSNLIGSVLFAAMVNASTQYNFTSGLLGAFTIKVAMGKLGMSFSSAFISGILCNFFVCIAVLMAAAAKDIAGKVWAIFFPIMAFVVSGYEHCVANMYYIPAGIFAAGNEAYVQKAMETYEGVSQLSRFNPLTCKDIFDAAAAGDMAAKEILEIVYDQLAQFLANVCNVVDPEIVVIGGGVSKAGEPLLSGVGRYVDKYLFHAVRGVKFSLATLGNDAGAYGAFKLILDEHNG